MLPTHTLQTLISVSGNMRWWTQPSLGIREAKNVTAACLCHVEVGNDVGPDLGWPIRGQNRPAVTNQRPGICHYVMRGWWCNKGTWWGHLRPVPHIANITITATTTTTTICSNKTWLLWQTGNQEYPEFLRWLTSLILASLHSENFRYPKNDFFQEVDGWRFVKRKDFEASESEVWMNNICFPSK